MVSFVMRRLLASVPTLLGAITVVFVALRMLPGDPALVILGDNAEEARLQDLRHQLGVDQPIWVQYGVYLVGLVRGDFGESLFSHQSALGEVLKYFPYTMELALASTLVACIVGVPLGVVSAVKRNSLLDHVCRVLSMVGISMPHFWFGLVLMWLFALALRWLPFSGGGELSDFGDNSRHLVLPMVVLGLSSAAVVARMTRSCMLEVLSMDYVRTARSKGLAERVVIVTHALKNSMIPVVTVIGLQVGVLMGGAVTIEVVFSRPGLGKLLFDSLSQNDYTQAQACLVVFTLVFIAVNLLTDITYALFDPRVEIQ